MLAIIDNGKGAEQIAHMIRGQKVIVKPEKADTKATAFILSDGDLKNQKHNDKIIKSFTASFASFAFFSLRRVSKFNISTSLSKKFLNKAPSFGKIPENWIKFE